MFNQDFINKCYAGYRASKVSTVMSASESMQNKTYMETGWSAVEVITGAVATSYLTTVNRVLDVPCGHGRVLRHLVKLFPEAEFTACDLDESGVKFCAETFGAQPIVSQPDLCDVNLNGLYDLIWVGSLFTHTPKDVTQRWMSHLTHFLNPTGIVVATFHGRWSETVHKHAPYIKAESWDKIITGYHQEGYGYADYVEKELSHEFIESGYGVSLSKASTVIDMVMQIPGVRLFMYSERAWADHQDVVVYGKPSNDKPWPALNSLRRDV